MLPVIGDHFSIVCSLINAYRPLFVEDISDDHKIADIMLRLLNESNKLKEYLDTLENNKGKALKWTRIDANNAFNDFPLLNLEQINEIILGWFQLKQAKKYAMEHLSKDGSFTVQVAKQRENSLRAQLQSRHRAAVTYNRYIQYSKKEVGGWYCHCYSGARVIGCCSHIASIIWYLAYARHAPQNLRLRSDSYLETLDNA